MSLMHGNFCLYVWNTALVACMVSRCQRPPHYLITHQAYLPTRTTPHISRYHAITFVLPIIHASAHDLGDPTLHTPSSSSTFPHHLLPYVGMLSLLRGRQVPRLISRYSWTGNRSSSTGLRRDFTAFKELRLGSCYVILGLIRSA